MKYVLNKSQIIFVFKLSENFGEVKIRKKINEI